MHTLYIYRKYSLQIQAVKRQSVPYSYWSLGGVLISLPKATSPSVVIPLLSVKHGQCDDRPTPSQPQGITAHWLVPNYAAWGQRHMCVNNLSRVALDSGEARIRTCDLRKSSVLTTRPSSHKYKNTSSIGVVIRLSGESRKLKA